MHVTNSAEQATIALNQMKPWRLLLLGLGCLLAFGLLAAVEFASQAVLVVREYQAARRNFAARAIDPYTGKPVTTTGLLNSQTYRGVNHAEIPHPYLGYVYAPFALGNIYHENTNPISPVGLYTDRYGFVHNGDVSRDLSVKRPGTVRIMLLGGSTAEGADSTPGNTATIAAHLERQLRERFEDSGLEIQVINAAHSGYATTQNFLNASLYLIDEYRPDVLIDLEGRNDWLRSVQTTVFIKHYNGLPDMAEWALSGRVVDSGVSSFTGLVGQRLQLAVANSAAATLIREAAGRLVRALGGDNTAEAPFQAARVKVVAGEQQKQAFNQSAGQRGYRAIV